MAPELYRYAEGDRLEDRNTYFYSQYRGAAFLSAWTRNRNLALDGLGAPQEAPPAADVAPADDDTAQALLERLYAATIRDNDPPSHLELLLQRFEVGKRLYGRYDENLRPHDRDDYRNLSHYLRFGEILEAAYAREGRLDHLNALMKALDILVSLRADLDDAECGRLARLLLRERESVANLAERIGIAP